MVRTKVIEHLKREFDELQELDTPSIYEVEGALQDAVFDVMTIDSHIAGLATRLIEGGKLSDQERGSIAKDFLVNKFDLAEVSTPREPISLASSIDVLDYVKKLEQLRLLILKC